MFVFVVGDSFHHCSECGDYDVCGECIEEAEHEHDDEMEAGVYPVFSPYSRWHSCFFLIYYKHMASSAGVISLGFTQVTNIF